MPRPYGWRILAGVGEVIRSPDERKRYPGERCSRIAQAQSGLRTPPIRRGDACVARRRGRVVKEREPMRDNKNALRLETPLKLASGSARSPHERQRYAGCAA